MHDPTPLELKVNRKLQATADALIALIEPKRKPVIVAGTGHRPDKLGGYGADVHQRLVETAVRGLQRFPAIKSVVSGMAIGWDTALADAALSLKLPLVCAIPFKGQEGRWPKASQDKYLALLAEATTIHYVCSPGYAAWKMQQRNEWMVDNSDVVLALWNGTSGGTGNCVQYADSVRKPIENVWNEWVALNQSVNV